MEDTITQEEHGVNGDGNETRRVLIPEIVGKETETGDLQPRHLESSASTELSTQNPGDAKPKRGGARPGAGRKSKAAEFGLATLIDSVWKIKDQKKALGKIVERANRGDMEATKLLLAYKYGKPAGEVKNVGQVDHVHMTVDQWQEEAARRRSEAEQAARDAGDL